MTEQSASNSFIQFFRKYLPSPFALAVILTVVAFILAGLFGNTQKIEDGGPILGTMEAWTDGFWDLLKFAMQMMLMLVLGHVLAMTKPVRSIIDKVLFLCKDTASAAFWVAFLTLIMAFLNWGLGLIFGALMARKVGEYAGKKGIPMNYPLLGAAGYAGLMVWHGGFSGSAPLKIAEAGHEFMDITGVIPISETLLSPMNISISIALLIIIPLAMYLIGKRVKPELPDLTEFDHQEEVFSPETPAEKLDGSKALSMLLGLIFLLGSVMYLFNYGLNPNTINMILLGCCLILSDHFKNFQDNTAKAIKGSTGIMIQFPLYAGIMGILKGAGLIAIISGVFVDISNPTTFPIFSFLSAGLVNFFVPSGGGQWAVQGGIILEAALTLGVAPGKGVMALAYGDQLTNMVQPFWALPLLGITGLKASQILPYTFLLMLIGSIIFIAGLLIF